MRFAFVLSMLMPSLALALPIAGNLDGNLVETRQVTFYDR
jgi:hypothetical protein